MLRTLHSFKICPLCTLSKLLSKYIRILIMLSGKSNYGLFFQCFARVSFNIRIQKNLNFFLKVTNFVQKIHITLSGWYLKIHFKRNLFRNLISKGTNRPRIESNMTTKRVVLKYHKSEISLSTLCYMNTKRSTKKFDIFYKSNFHYFFFNMLLQNCVNFLFL